MPNADESRQIAPWGGKGLMWFFTGLARILPRRLGYAIAEGGARLLGRIFSSWRKVLESNLAVVMEDADPRQIRRTAYDILATFARAYYELLYLPSVPREEVAQMVTIVGPGWPALQENQRRKEGAILISTHQSSFDLAGQVLAARGFPGHVLALPEQVNSLLFFTELRELAGNRVMPLSPRAIREAFRVLRRGGMVVTAADRPVRGQGVEVEFFGRPTVLPDGHVRLALRTGATLFPLFCFREDGEYFLRVEEFELQRTGDREADVRDNVQRIAHLIEEPIRAHPEQWHLFWKLWP